MKQQAEVARLETEGVRGFLHSPGESARRGIVLTHGAGSDCTAPLLVTVANAFCSAGFSVLRCDLPFRQRRPKGPPSPSGAAADRAGLKRAAEVLRDLVEAEIFLGGVSYGGRQATMLTADEPGIARGLLLMSYPLHAPGKPEQKRTQHFPRLQTPALFVHGTADPFGSIAEMQEAIAMIPGPTQMLIVEGAGHGLGGRRFDPSAAVAALLSLRAA